MLRWSRVEEEGGRRKERPFFSMKTAQLHFLKRIKSFERERTTAAAAAERSFLLIQFVRAEREREGERRQHQIRFLRSWRRRINFSNSLRKTNYVGIFRESLSTELFDTAVLSLLGKARLHLPGDVRRCRHFFPIHFTFPHINHGRFKTAAKRVIWLKSSSLARA